MTYSSGCAKHENFLKLFDDSKLKSLFNEHFPDVDITLFGEAYGGKINKMSETYGKDLKFIVFDVKIDNTWLNIPNADDITNKFGLEFISYHKISTDLKSIDAERDLPSVQAVRNGIKEPKIREGVVLRPLIELIKNNGNRIIVKHKRPEFLETKTMREVNPETFKVLENAKAIAEEWVTPNRLKNILSHLPTDYVKIENTGNIIKLFIEDIYREAKGEIIETKEVKKAIGAKTAKLFKKYTDKI